ncbi:hypothetical protein KBC85_01020 [Candidatus Saccharibacteria bacterium]|nr:hypothetical protein [Candidatus Saccharibacteria bacterium]MDQ5953546.1 hypothetical protein [Patescibacteria group bacterium]
MLYISPTRNVRESPREESPREPRPVVSRHEGKSRIDPRIAYWIGRTASYPKDPDNAEHPELYDRGLRFRGRVYVDDMHFLRPEDKDELGRETDDLDSSSLHIAVVAMGGGQEDIKGGARVIFRDRSGKLPIEEYFTDIDDDLRPKPGSVEVSRFIARDEDEFTQHKINLALIRAITRLCGEHKVPSVYFVIEQPFWDLLQSIGMPMKQLGAAKRLPDYNDTLNIPVMIKPEEVDKSVTKDKTDSIILREFFDTKRAGNGMGYFQSNLMRRVEMS